MEVPELKDMSKFEMDVPSSETDENYKREEKMLHPAGYPLFGKHAHPHSVTTPERPGCNQPIIITAPGTYIRAM